MAPKRASKKLRRWIVKAGSNIVCDGGPLLMRSWMQQIARLRKEFGIEVIWVTSGAIASGIERTSFKSKRRSLTEKQALSAVGQPLLMDLYNIALQSTGLLGAQILLTYDDMLNAKRRHYLKTTLATLLKWNIVPILNENDATATEEIRFGDNDALSAKVAHMMAAERLLILTDVEGLYNVDPRRDPKAQLIHGVPRVTKRVLALTGEGAGTSRGTGGMRSKLMAASLTARHGIETWLVRGDAPDLFATVARNENIGTRIEALK